MVAARWLQAVNEKLLLRPMFRALLAHAALSTSSSTSPSSACGGTYVPLKNTSYALRWVENLTGVAHAGYAFLDPSVLARDELLLTQFGATPFVGKSAVSLINLTESSVHALTTHIDWPNTATLVDDSVWGGSRRARGSRTLLCCILQRPGIKIH